MTRATYIYILDQFLGVAVVLRFCFMAHSVKLYDMVRIQGVSARTFSTRLFGKLWEPVTKTAL